MNEVVSPRIARFVAAARSLLVLQVVAALLALVIALWAFVEVRGLAAERDRLKARVAELEAQRGAPVPAIGPTVPLGPDPLLNQPAPYDIPPDYNLIAPPVVAPDVNTLIPTPVPVPVPAPAAPVANQQQPAVQPETGPDAPARRWDCSGANAQNPRCRPLMERPNLPLNSLEPRGPALGPGTSPNGNRQGPG